MNKFGGDPTFLSLLLKLMHKYLEVLTFVAKCKVFGEQRPAFRGSFVACRLVGSLGNLGKRLDFRAKFSKLKSLFRG